MKTRWVKAGIKGAKWKWVSSKEPFEGSRGGAQGKYERKALEKIANIKTYAYFHRHPKTATSQPTHWSWEGKKEKENVPRRG